VDGLRIHYVTAGSGEPVVLISGWPEMSWIAWRKVIPLLVQPDARSTCSNRAALGTATSPGRLRPRHRGPRPARLPGRYRARPPAGVDIVAHDVGTWIAHAHAAAYPGEVKRLVLTESNVPGITPPPPAAFRVKR